MLDWKLDFPWFNYDYWKYMCVDSLNEYLGLFLFLFLLCALLDARMVDTFLACSQSL